jgi:hypothetical protein
MYYGGSANKKRRPPPIRRKTATAQAKNRRNFEKEDAPLASSGKPALTYITIPLLKGYKLPQIFLQAPKVADPCGKPQIGG